MDCEACEERKKQEEILNRINGNGKKEYEILQQDNFKEWYNNVSRFSKQLKECLLSGESYNSKMVELFNELKELDLAKDKEKIINIISTILDYARMQEVTINVTKKTAEMLIGQIHGG